MKQSIIDLLPEFIFGFEGEEDGDSGDSSNDSGNDSGEQNGAAGSSSDSSSKHDDADDPNVKGLKAALETERRERKALEKKIKAAEKVQEEAALAEKSEAEREKIRAEKAEEKATKLAAGFVRKSLDSAIDAAAKKAGFIDTDDALKGVDRSDIPVEQDEDDPSEVTIDTKAVERLVKALAAKKPHFIRTGTEDGEATGSGFGGSKPKKKTAQDQDLENYPSLR